MNLMVYNGITYEKLLKVVPSPYKVLLTKTPPERVFEVVIFPNNEVILSGKIKKAFRRTEGKDDRMKMFIGHCFTEESKTIMHENNIVFAELNNFHWTDSSYIDICQRKY